MKISINPFAQDNPDRHIFLPLWAAGDGVGTLSAIIAPLLAGVYMGDLGFSGSVAGWVLAVEFGILALVNFAIAPFMGRISRRKIAIFGTAMALIANAVSVYSDSSQSLLLIRSFAGFGAGLALAAANASSAGASDPSRLYGHRLATLALTATLIFIVVPPVIETFGPAFLFVAMAVINLVLIVPILKFPQGSQLKASSASIAHSRSVATTSSPDWIIGGLIVSALMIFFLRDTMAYIYLERIGVGIGISRENVGQIIAVSTIIGISGPLIAVWLGKRFGLLRMALIYGILGALISHGIVVAGTVSIFTMVVLLQPLENLGGYTLHMALASEADPQGRITTACGGVVLSSFAASSLVLGYASEFGGTKALVIVMAVFATMHISSLLLIMRIRKRLR